MDQDNRDSQQANPQERKPPLIIHSEEEFLALMEDIDREMASEGVKITARPFVAGMKITERYDVVLDACPPLRPPKTGSFEPIEISIRIHNWVEQRYGERIKLPYHIGRVVLPLRGALYVINCPKVFGTVRFVCEPHNFSQARETIGIHDPPTCNMIDLIEDLTPGFARSLSSEEVIKIGIAFVTGMGAYSALCVISGEEYVREAIGDLEAAVFHLMEHRPQPGLSKWASFQAVEKLIKAFIARKGGKVDKDHKLEKHVNQAERLGLPRPPQQYIIDIRCPADVRYGKVVVSVEEAVKTHLLSLEICEVVAQHVGKALNRRMPVIPEPKVEGMSLGQFIQKHVKLTNP